LPPGRAGENNSRHETFHPSRAELTFSQPIHGK
jgi:hypothetical protein